MKSSYKNVLVRCVVVVVVVFFLLRFSIIKAPRPQVTSVCLCIRERTNATRPHSHTHQFGDSASSSHL